MNIERIVNCILLYKEEFKHVRNSDSDEINSGRCNRYIFLWKFYEIIIIIGKTLKKNLKRITVKIK